MHDAIKQVITFVEHEHNIKLLFACESGSRGWGFPSPDSDYDVRFIYIRPVSHYLSVMDKADDLRLPATTELDVYGWDLRKVLQLVRKSNTTPFEWLQSPIIYAGEDAFREDMWDLCQHYYSRRSNIHHYLGIARGAMEGIEGGQIGIKRLFYVLRPLLAALWSLEKNSIAPMRIEPLMELLPKSISEEVASLIKRKTRLKEHDVVEVSPRLWSYIQRTFDRVSKASTPMAKDNFSPDRLDEYFIKTIQQYDHRRNKVEAPAVAGMYKW